MTHLETNHVTLAAHSLPRLVVTTLVAGVLLLGAGSAEAAATPGQKCQATKNKTAGKYGVCRQSAEAKLATTADSVKYNAALTKCGTKFANAWQKAIDKAATASATCPDAPLTGGAFQSVIDGHTNKVAVALAGGGLQDCGNGTLEAPEQCDGVNLNGQACADRPGFTVGTLRCASGCTYDTSGCFATRLADNGDGTVTDHETGLQWEQKTTSFGSGVNLADPHDVDNTYTWTGLVYPGATPNGTAFTDFLGTLNTCTTPNGTAVTDAGFAGHCDWRLPTIQELKTILLAPYPCATSPCIDPIFGPTFPFDLYWSATTHSAGAGSAWSVLFFDGFDTTSNKDYGHPVRAVRGGL